MRRRILLITLNRFDVMSETDGSLLHGSRTMVNQFHNPPAADTLHGSSPPKGLFGELMFLNRLRSLLGKVPFLTLTAHDLIFDFFHLFTHEGKIRKFQLFRLQLLKQLLLLQLQNVSLLLTGEITVVDVVLEHAGLERRLQLFLQNFLHTAVDKPGIF